MPDTPDAWITEIAQGYQDAKEAIPFGEFVGQPMTEEHLFHLAPAVTLKFRGIKQTGANRSKATQAALCSYVASEDTAAQGLAIPQMAFAFCYVASHMGLDLITEEEASELLDAITERLPQLIEKTEGKSSATAEAIDRRAGKTQGQAADELCGIIEQADTLQADSILIEFDKEGGLDVAYLQGEVPIAAGPVPKELDGDVMELIHEQAGLEEDVSGSFSVQCEDHVLDIHVNEYNSFGETAYILHMPRRRRGKRKK